MGFMTPKKTSPSPCAGTDSRLTFPRIRKTAFFVVRVCDSVQELEAFSLIPDFATSSK